MNPIEYSAINDPEAYPFIKMPHILPDVKYHKSSIDSKNKYEFFHMHPDREAYYAFIDKHGYCTSCERYILPYKMLEVMVALKELNG